MIMFSFGHFTMIFFTESSFSVINIILLFITATSLNVQKMKFGVLNIIRILFAKTRLLFGIKLYVLVIFVLMYQC